MRGNENKRARVDRIVPRTTRVSSIRPTLIREKLWEMIFESRPLKSHWASRHTQEVINSSLR